MEETYVIILIIAILILILYFINFSGKNNNATGVNGETIKVNGETNGIIVQQNQQVSSNQFKPYNPTENFDSCGGSQVQSPTITQITQQINVDATGKASLKVHVALWCGWSKRLLAQLDSDDFKNKFKDVENICVLDIIDCVKNKEKCDPSIVRGFPTIILQKKTGEMVPYKGDRSTDDLINFIKANSS